LQVRRRAGYFLARFLPEQGLVGHTLEDQQVPVLFLMQTRVRSEVNEFPASRARRGQFCLEGRPIDLAFAHSHRAVGQRDCLALPPPSYARTPWRSRWPRCLCRWWESDD
jgi:hypothetical protein